MPAATSKTAAKRSKQSSKKDAGELFLIDGNSMAYRAFFALPESIATHDGRPTNAIYGLASMFAKMLTDHTPKAVVVAWDAGWSGREKTYEPYKAQRKSRPDLLKEQWPHLMPLAEAFGFSNIKVDGYEADDVIASLTKRAREQGIDVMVVSGDRDVYQLVEDGVRVMTTSRGVTDTKIYDRDGVIERYGVPPERVTDLIGLKGDTSDNIPGVPGIGDKTAAQLLQEYGDVEGVLANIENISGAKRKENLTNHADDARVSKELATAIIDIDFELDLDELMAAEMDRSRLREVAREHELRIILERMEEDLGADFVPESSAEETIEVAAEEGSVSDLAKGEVAVAVAGGTWAAADAKKVVTGEEPDLGKLAKDLSGRPLIGHDIKSLGGGGQHGLLAACATEDDLDLHHDTMVGAYMLDPARRTYDLIDIAAQRGLATAPEEKTRGRRRRPARPRRGAAARPRRRGPPGLRDREAPAQVHEGAGPREAHGRGRDAPGRGPGRDGAGRSDARRRAPGRDRQGVREADRQAREGHPQARRPRLHDRLPAAALRGPLRRPRPDQEAPGQDRLLHRRPRPRPDPRRAQDHSQDRGVARADQAQEHLPRRPPRPDRPRHGPHPHHLQPDRDRDGPPLQHEPEPPEHPHPQRRGPPDPLLLRRPARPAPALGRLQPDRVAHPGPDRRRGRPARDLRPGRGHPHGHRGRGPGRGPVQGHARRALQGEDGQLRHRLRPLRVRPLGPPQHRAGRGRASTSSATSSASRR